MVRKALRQRLRPLLHRIVRAENVLPALESGDGCKPLARGLLLLSLDGAQPVAHRDDRQYSYAYSRNRLCPGFHVGASAPTIRPPLLRVNPPSRFALWRTTRAAHRRYAPVTRGICVPAIVFPSPERRCTMAAISGGSMRRPTIAIVLLAFISVVAFAQADPGSITGTLTDPDGVVVSATVQARHAITGKVYTTTSVAMGRFTLKDLPAGTYEIR